MKSNHSGVGSCLPPGSSSTASVSAISSAAPKIRVARRMEGREGRKLARANGAGSGIISLTFYDGPNTTVTPGYRFR
jgi:hypothetical protein